MMNELYVYMRRTETPGHGSRAPTTNEDMDQHDYNRHPLPWTLAFSAWGLLIHERSFRGLCAKIFKFPSNLHETVTMEEANLFGSPLSDDNYATGINVLDRDPEEIDKATTGFALCDNPSTSVRLHNMLKTNLDELQVATGDAAEQKVKILQKLVEKGHKMYDDYHSKVAASSENQSESDAGSTVPCTPSPFKSFEVRQNIFGTVPAGAGFVSKQFLSCSGF